MTRLLTISLSIILTLMVLMGGQGWAQQCSENQMARLNPMNVGVSGLGSVPAAAASSLQQYQDGDDSDRKIALNAGSIWYSIRFKASGNYTIDSVKVRLLKVGSPSFNVVAKIYSDSSGKPGSQTGGDSGSVAASSIGTSYEDKQFTWSSGKAAVTLNDYFHIVLLTDGYGDTDNCIQNRYAATGVGDSTIRISYGADGLSWNYLDVDCYGNYEIWGQ